MDIKFNSEALLETIDNIINQLNNIKKAIYEQTLVGEEKMSKDKSILDKPLKTSKKVTKTIEKQKTNKDGYYDYYDINARPEIKM